MKTSARNQLPCEIVGVEIGAVGAVIKMRTDSACDVTTFITREAAEVLRVKKGDKC